MTSRAKVAFDFQGALQRGLRWQEYVAEILNLAKVSCFIPKEPPLPDKKSKHELTLYEKQKAATAIFADDIDIQCTSGVQIEVKSRKVRFTSPDDFPYSTLKVETVSSYSSRNNAQPDMYISVSTITGCLIAISKDSKELWGVESYYDRVRGFRDSWYVAPKSFLLSQDDALKWLLERQDKVLVGF